jgi:RNA polymerase sigma factor (sigma-70 family)
MTDALDMDLVREFARDHSEAAFTELVRRHLNLVYSIARRRTDSDGDAQDVSQAVFVILARKAADLRARAVLTGWLYETTRYTAACMQRTNARRHAREQEAYMQSTLADTDTAADWHRLAPHLEAAVSQLGERDRTLLALRFYENKSGPEAAALLCIREAAAHKRTARALEKLRKFFTRRGVALSAAAIAGAVSANSVQAAPVGLAATISVAAAKGAAVTATVATLVKGTLKLMNYAKLKLTVSIAAGILLTGGVVVDALSGNSVDNTTDPVAEAILNKVFEKYASLSAYSDSGKSFTAYSTNTFSIQLGRLDLYRMEWDAVGTGSGFSGAAWSAGDGHFQFFTGTTWKNIPQRFHRMKGLGEALEGSGNISGGAALTIPPVFFGKPVSDGFGLLGLCSNFKKHDDAKIGAIDCYVLTGHLKTWRDVPISLWIGKDDLLIHQIQRTTLDPDPNVAPPTNTPEFKKLLDEWSKATTPEEKAAIQEKIQMAGAQFSAKTRKPMLHTEIHENIIVNQPLANEKFVYPVPAGLKPLE